MVRESFSPKAPMCIERSHGIEIYVFLVSRRVSAPVCVCQLVCVCVYIKTYKHACIHAYIHTYTHIKYMYVASSYMCANLLAVENVHLL